MNQRVVFFQSRLSSEIEPLVSKYNLETVTRAFMTPPFLHGTLLAYNRAKRSCLVFI